MTLLHSVERLVARIPHSLLLEDSAATNWYWEMIAVPIAMMFVAPSVAALGWRVHESWSFHVSLVGVDGADALQL